MEEPRVARRELLELEEIPGAMGAKEAQRKAEQVVKVKVEEAVAEQQDKAVLGAVAAVEMRNSRP
jgi:hypothetical protein